MPVPVFDLVVHATHEAGLKVGGIGAVLDGLLGQSSYNDAVRRTILVGPLDARNSLEMERLFAPRNAFQAHYFSTAGLYDVEPAVARAFTQIEMGYQVRLLYGKRRFGSALQEVLLVDASDAGAQATSDFKFHLWQTYGIDSYRYQRYPEYEQVIGAAEPEFAALQVLAGELAGKRAVILAHEWLGLPLAFCARRHQPGVYRTVFYAHETATVRPIVEGHPGHDTRFYNVMFAARDQGLQLQDLFGDQSAYFKHALVSAAAGMDAVFAVGNLVVDELRFLSTAYASRSIALVYNGIPAAPLALADRWRSKERLQHYAQNILGYRPSWIFTHVTRLVLSKALWRDVRVMERLDAQLAARGESAVLFALSTSIPNGRRGDDVRRWEAQYGWPVGHRGDNGDLTSDEWPFYRAAEAYNRSAHASRIVLVNQFGWSRDRCGQRMPADMEFADIRNGSDLEFGQSIYEPFGIGQLEPLSGGSVCCISNVCGCAGFVIRGGGIEQPNVVLADYVTLPSQFRGLGLSQLLSIGQHERDAVEDYAATSAAQRIDERLPRDESTAQVLLDDGYALAQKMSWQVVVEQMLLPELDKLF